MLETETLSSGVQKYPFRQMDLSNNPIKHSVLMDITMDGVCGDTDG